MKEQNLISLNRWKVSFDKSNVLTLIKPLHLLSQNVLQFNSIESLRTYGTLGFLRVSLRRNSSVPNKRRSNEWSAARLRLSHNTKYCYSKEVISRWPSLATIRAAEDFAKFSQIPYWIYVFCNLFWLWSGVVLLSGVCRACQSKPCFPWSMYWFLLSSIFNFRLSNVNRYIFAWTVYNNVYVFVCINSTQDDVNIRDTVHKITFQM